MRSPAPPTTPSLRSPTLSTPLGDAVERLAWEDAVDLLARAEALALRTTAPPERLAEVLVALGEARLRAGEGDAGRAAFEEAARLARVCARDDMLARAALGAAGLAVTIVAVDEPWSRSSRRRSSASTRSRGRCGSGCSPGLRSRSPTRPPRGADTRWPRRRSRAARALADPGALAVALTAAHVVYWAPEHLGARLIAADELVTLGERSDDLEIELHGRHWRVADLLERGDVAAAEEEVARYERVAAAARLPAFSWYVPAWRAALAGYRGDLPSARRLADEAYAQGTHARDANADLVLSANQYTLHSLRRRGTSSTSPTSVPRSTRRRAGRTALTSRTAWQSLATTTRRARCWRRRRPRASTACRGTRT